jgi:predicted ferric reductase
VIRRDPFALVNVLVLAAVATIILGVWVLKDLGGWAYYTTPLRIRGYDAHHHMLRPSGSVAHLLGIAGLAMMTMPVIYSVRKKWSRLSRFGSMKAWLEVHIFCGIVGPMLVTFHTAFKFNGIVSVAYWSMVTVTLSGFVGRYLYVRIPKSIRGQELTQKELDERARDLSDQIAEAKFPKDLLAKIDAFENRVVPAHAESPSLFRLFAGEIQMRHEIRRFRREIERGGVLPDLQHHAVDLIAERATLLRRIAYLKKTKKVFDLWHVFHMPLVYIMFVIVLMHVVVTVYMGYVPFGS